MQLEMPEDFDPKPLPRPLLKRKSPGQMYWIWDENGKAKKYSEASSEEVLAFLQSLTRESSSQTDPDTLELLTIRTAILDLILTKECIIHSSLLHSEMLKDEFFKIRNKTRE